MRTIAHIDSWGVGMDYPQTRVLRLQPSRQFFLRFSISPQPLIRVHLYAPETEIGIRLGLVTNGLRNSPTGSKNRYHEVLATRLVIASTGAMLIVGHKAPFRISALACRIESRIHTGKTTNSRQVSGTSDASKTQSGLVRG